MIFDSGETIDGSLADSSPATVDVVTIRPGTYSVRVTFIFEQEGTSHVQNCDRNRGCRDSDQRLLIGATMPAIEGTFDDPNHVSGSKSDVKTGTGYRGTGKVTTTLTWNLAREGKSQ